jgi:5-methylcytosine-specific restriction enzyme A
MTRSLPTDRTRTKRAPDTRPSAARRGYGARWQRARKAFLANNPLCVQCAADGHTVAASVVDHAVAHRGDMAIFWDQSNWQALCARCHNTKTARCDGAFGRVRTGNRQKLTGKDRIDSAHFSRKRFF